MTDSTSGPKWSICYPTPELKKAVDDICATSQAMAKKWTAFKADVTKDPYHHQKQKRIAKLRKEEGYPEDAHRYRNEPIRVIYVPHAPTYTVFPIDVGKSEDISYKKQSSRGSRKGSKIPIPSPNPIPADNEKEDAGK